MKIFNRDGGFTEVDVNKVEVIQIKSEDILKLVSVSNGAEIHFKDGSFRLIEGVKTDGISLEFNM